MYGGRVESDVDDRMSVTARRRISMRPIRPRGTPVIRSRLAIAICFAMAAGCATYGRLAQSFRRFENSATAGAGDRSDVQAAGFSALPATTADQDTRLKTLPALKLGYYDDAKGVRHYWMADPEVCKCIFHGDEAAYQRYENIKLENQVAERDRHAVEMQQQQQRWDRPVLVRPVWVLAAAAVSASAAAASACPFNFTFFTVGRARCATPG